MERWSSTGTGWKWNISRPASAAGQVTFGGFVTYGRTLGFNLTANGNEIRFRYAGISVTVGRIAASGGHAAKFISDRQCYGYPFCADSVQRSATFALAQAARRPAPDREFAAQQSPSRCAHPFDSRVDGADLAGQVVRRCGSAPARALRRGPVLLGRINIAEGDIKLAGTKYHLERGDITFTDPVRIDPVLDVEATTRVRDYDITIGLHGTMERLNTTYRSDPPLSSEDIVSLLAFGTNPAGERDERARRSPGFAESASGAHAQRRQSTRRFPTACRRYLG